MGAGGIYPLAWSDGKITSCAFAFPTTRKEKNYTLLQLHLPGSASFSIKSTLFDEETGDELPVDQLGFEKVIAIGSTALLLLLPAVRLYGWISTRRVDLRRGSLFPRSGGADSAQPCSRIYPWAQTPAAPPYMTEQDEQGKPVFDTSESVFCSPPGKNTTFPADLSTPLRAEEHSAALAAATEFLRIACGLGKTPAEELVLLRTYRARFAEMLTEMVVSTARLLGQLEPEQVDILFDSLPFSERIAANAALVRDGLRFKVSALSNLLGCSDTAAKKELEKVTAQAVERAGAEWLTSHRAPTFPL